MQISPMQAFWRKREMKVTIPFWLFKEKFNRSPLRVMPIEGLNINISRECGQRLLSAAPTLFDQLRYFDAVFGRPFRCFSITLTAILSLSDRYKMFTSDWLWIEVCRNVVLIRNRYHYDNNKQKNFEIDKIRILRYLDLLLKIRHQEL